MEGKSKKAIIICYYWPPASGGGVMRWFKMAKYWKEFGGELIVFTPQLEKYGAYDPSLLNEIPKDLEVIKTPIWEPYDIYKKFIGQDDRLYSGFLNSKKKTWKSELGIWIRSNFFIPDARKYWIKPSIEYLKDYLSKNEIDVVVTTGTPHSLHMIGLALKKELNINWIADFRDPWTDIDYADQLKLTRWARKSHEKKEKEVLQTADHIVTVSWAWKDLMSKISGKNNVSVITNGYDPADFVELEHNRPDKFLITHLGSMNFNRNPAKLWTAIRRLTDKNPAFKKALRIQLIGQVDRQVQQDIIKKGIGRFVIHESFLNHKVGLQRLMDSSLLLLLVSNWSKSQGMIPGKTYEYLATGRPILAIGSPGSDVSKVMSDSPHSKFFLYADESEIVDFIEARWEEYQREQEQIHLPDISQYSRRELAGQYQKLIDDL